MYSQFSPRFYHIVMHQMLQCYRYQICRSWSKRRLYIPRWLGNSPVTEGLYSANNSEIHKGGREGGRCEKEGGREGGDQEKERGEGKKEGGVWEGKPSITIIHSLGSVGCVCVCCIAGTYLPGRGVEKEGEREGGEKRKRGGGGGGKEGGREGGREGLEGGGGEGVEGKREGGR